MPVHKFGGDWTSDKLERGFDGLAYALDGLTPEEIQIVKEASN